MVPFQEVVATKLTVGPLASAVFDLLQDVLVDMPNGVVQVFVMKDEPLTQNLFLGLIVLQEVPSSVYQNQSLALCQSHVGEELPQANRQCQYSDGFVF